MGVVARGRPIREANQDARSAPRRGEDRPQAIRINRTTDTRIFSIGLNCSASFLFVPNSLIQIGFSIETRPFMFWIYRSDSVLFLAYLHGNYTQKSAPPLSSRPR